MKHTKGPWIFRTERCSYGLNGELIGVVDSPRGPICNTEESTVEETIANAQLIAAAPEMYEALVAVFQARAPQLNFDFSNAPDMQLLEKAIKKAEGK